MMYYCKHKKETIARGKVIAYCLKRDCWALMMFSSKRKMARFVNKNKTCRGLKKGV